MKLSKLTCTVAIATSALMTYNAKAVVDLPTIPVNISGVVAWQSDYVTNGAIVKASIKKHSFNNKILIQLLNESSAATNTIADVTGVSQIPAGSKILFDIYDEELIITNKNGFSFPLYGYDAVADSYYDYGYLDFDYDVLFGSSSLNKTTGAGTERDLTGVEFWFYNNDSGDNYVELEPEYGNGSFSWTFGAVSGGNQTASVIFNASPAGYYAYVGSSDAITTSCHISGSGKATIYSLGEPFCNWW